MTAASELAQTLESLDEARDAWTHGERSRTLAALIAAWQSSRRPEIAAAIDRVTHLLLGRERSPPTADDWLSADEDTDRVQRGRLLAHLGHGTVREIHQRLEQVGEWPLDPRLVPALVSLVRQHGQYRLKKPGWRLVFKLLTRLRDTRAVEALSEPLDDPWLDARRRMTLATIQRRRRSRPLSDETVGWLRSVAGGPDADPMGESLLAEVLDAPDDDQKALVYADWLLQRGEPRGELILLQRSPERSPEQERRIAALLREHGERWLGPLAPAVDLQRSRFEGGFLTVAGLRALSGRAVTSLVGHPSWKTVRSVSLAPRTARWSLRGDRAGALILDNPTMVRLEEVHGLSPHHLERVVDRERSWRVLGIRRPWGGAAVEPVLAGTALPNLEELHLQWSASRSALLRLTDAPLLDRIDVLVITGFDVNRDGTTRWLEAVRPGGLSRITFVSRAWRVSVRKEDGQWSRVECVPRERARMAELAHILEGIPAEPVVSVDIEADGEHVLLDVVLERFAGADIRRG